MDKRKALELALLAACKRAADELGDDIKKMSWFGRNHRPAAAELPQAA
ncbi:MAG: hypothetical protein RIC14_00180 [Filomicrobium sp.]